MKKRNKNLNKDDKLRELIKERLRKEDEKKFQSIVNRIKFEKKINF